MKVYAWMDIDETAFRNVFKDIFGNRFIEIC